MPTARCCMLCLVLVAACAQARSGDARGDLRASASAIIYGEDDRVEPYELIDRELYELATESSIAMIPVEAIIADASGAVRVEAPAFGERYGLCAGQGKFGDQPAAAVCSGTLVEPDLVLTAGHCLRGNACEAMRFVRGFFYQRAGELNAIDEQDVYRCRGVVARQLSARDAVERYDYAWVRLDRPVREQLTIEFRPREDPVAAGERLILAGYSGGVPLKVDEGGVVTDARSAHGDYFFFNADAFLGNSGGGVFDRARRLVAVDGRGGSDFTATIEGCNALARASDDPAAAQEQATNVARALEGMCAAEPDSEVCCNAGLHCPSPPAGCALVRATSDASDPGFGATAAALALVLVLRRRRRLVSAAST